MSKTKEMVVNFRREKQRCHYTPLRIYRTLVESTHNYRYLRVQISVDLTWTTHISTPVKKVRQCLYHLRWLRKCKISAVLQRTFYNTAVESVVSGSITVWYGSCTAMDS